MTDGTLKVQRLSPAGPQRQEVALSPMDALTRRIAAGESFDINALERLVALHERTEAQRRKESFDAALTAAQSEMPRVGKNGLVQLGGNKGYNYARLEDVDACIRSIYERHGFSVRFDAPTSPEGKIRITAHVSAFGHTEQTEITVPPDTGPGRSAVQAVKSSITAARRHLLEMFFNVIEVGADEVDRKPDPCITENQALDIETRINDAVQPKPGFLLEALKRKHRVNRIGEIKASQYDAVIADVEAAERRGR